MAKRNGSPVSDKDLFLVVALIMAAIAYGCWTYRDKARVQLAQTNMTIQSIRNEVEQNKSHAAKLSGLLKLTKGEGIKTISPDRIIEALPLLDGFVVTAGRRGTGTVNLMWQSKEPNAQEIIEITQYVKELFGANEAVITRLSPLTFALSVEAGKVR